MKRKGGFIMKSLQSKFLTLIISGLFVMMLVVTMIGLFTTNKILHDNASDMLETACDKEAGDINALLSDIKNSVNIINNKVTEELVSANALRNGSYLKDYTRTIKSSFSNVAENTPGVVAYYLRYDPELTTDKSGFYITIDRNGNFTELTPSSISYDSDEAQAKWFFEPYYAGKPTWLTPYYHSQTDELMISYVAPLYKESIFIGVVGMDVAFSSITSKIEEIKPYDNGYAYLTNAGELVFAPDDIPEEDSNDKNAISTATASLHNGMILNVAANYTDIQKDSYPLLNRIMISFVIVLAIFSAVTIFMTKRITAPLEELTAAAEKFAVGRGKIDLKHNSNDEIGKLAKTLTQTSERLEEYASYINALAYRDSLTGVKNATAYKEACHNFEKALGDGSVSQFALVVSDINGLKATNDSYGHEAGNELIRKSVKRICDVFTHSPVYRIGGDEFVTILKGTDYDNRYELLARLENITTEEFFRFGEYHLPLSVASGMAEYSAEENDNFDTVFERADKAMYIRKQKLKGKDL